MKKSIHKKERKKYLKKVRRRDEMRTYRNDKLWENFLFIKAHGECICTSK